MATIIDSKKMLAGASACLAYTMINPVLEDFQDTFGKSFLYHPFAMWLCIVMMVYSQTSSLETGVFIVIAYEVIKCVWRFFHPESPRLGKRSRHI